jgi:hypothetical protein
MSDLSTILSDPRVKGLGYSAFKVYLYLLNQAGTNRQIENFSMRKQIAIWKLDPELHVTKNIRPVQYIITELKAANLIKVEKKILYIL